MPVPPTTQPAATGGDAGVGVWQAPSCRDALAGWAAAGPPAWLDTDPSITTPTPARVINALVGGFHNFAVDRELADEIKRAWPGYAPLVWAQRAFAVRAVNWLTAQGVCQFLDIGCGVPAFGAVHDTAGPHVRIVYADLDPVVVSLASGTMANQRNVAVVHGDLRNPSSILDHSTTQTHLDFSRPVAVLLTGVLPHVADSADPGRIVAQIRDAVVPGSFLVVSHLAPVAAIRAGQDHVQRLYDRTPTPVCLRTSQQLARLVSGWERVAPAIVPVIDWHPDPNRQLDPPLKDSLLGAVARAR